MYHHFEEYELQCDFFRKLLGYKDDSLSRPEIMALYVFLGWKHTVSDSN
jgi:hypothetical protein